MKKTAEEILLKITEKHFNKDVERLRGRFKNRNLEKDPNVSVMIEAMEEYASQFRPEWIKIESEEYLPKDSSNYWIFRSDGRVSSIDHYESDKKYFFPDLTATHYMPIIKPEPPKED